MKRTFMSVDHALRELALRNGTTVEEVRKEIKLAMLAGLCNTDPAVREKWREISCIGEAPMPEELIAYAAETICAQMHCGK